MSPNSFVVLLSGGLDSVVNLYWAHRDGQVLKALTFDYGQRAARNEIAAAGFFCNELKIDHQVIDMTWLGKITSTALVQRKQTLPHLKNLDDLGEGEVSAKAVWVPNRNGVFLNVAAAFAESLGAAAVVPGFNKEEAATFPDNSQQFIEATNGAFQLSTLSHVKVKCFTTSMDKAALILQARELGVNLKKVWSCYEAGSAPCGVCESCQRTQRAIKVVDGKMAQESNADELAPK